MKKRIFASLLACVMVMSGFAVSADLAPQIGFIDADGADISYLPDFGKVEVSAPEGAQAVVIAEYSKASNELLRVAVGDSVSAASFDEVNDFDSSTYVKAFAMENWESIKPLSKSATIVKNPGKTLLVSYANGIDESEAYNGGKDNYTMITYGSAAYSARRKAQWEKGQSFDGLLPEEQNITDYDIVKIRYYAGDKNTDRFWFCLMSNETYGSYNSLTNRYLYTPVIPENEGWNVAEIDISDMSKNNNSDNSDTPEDDSIALPLEDVTHFGFMAEEKFKLFGKDDPEKFNQSLYIDSVWLEKEEKIVLGEKIDFGSSDAEKLVATTSNLSVEKTIADEGKTRSAKVSLTADKSHPSNGSGMIKLSDFGVPTDWSGYEALRIRYYKSNPAIRFNVIMANSSTRGSSSSTGEDNFYMIPYNNPAAKQFWDDKAGWNTMTIPLSKLTKWGKNSEFGLDSINYLQIMTDEAGKIYPSGSSYTYLDTDVLCISSIELLDDVKLEADNEINFNSSNDWVAMKNATTFSLSSDVSDTANGSERSAMISKSTSNTSGYIDLADVGFTTDWSSYKTLNIRYKTSNTEYVPPVYLSTTNANWVTSGGIDGQQQAYRLKDGLYASKKSAVTEWTTVSYRLPVNDDITYSDFTTYGAAGKISVSNIPYILIPTHHLSQYWNGDSVGMVALDVSATKVYIDKIWLSTEIDTISKFDFSNNSAWIYIGSMKQFRKATDFGYGEKNQSAKLSDTTSNTTGYIDLAKAGFETDWSQYKTINIRYYTDNTSYVPPVYLSSTNENWVTSSGLDGKHGAYKLKSGIYTEKKPAEAGWHIVSYKLPVDDSTADSDFSYYGTKDKLKISDISYLFIPNHNFKQYWGGDSEVTSNSVDTSANNVYVDSVWLEK